MKYKRIIKLNKVKVDEYIDEVYIGEYDMYIGVYDKGAKHRVLK